MEACCRICHEGKSRELGKLIRPCRCAGSVGLVHKTCLDQWRKSGVNIRNVHRCEACHADYRYDGAYDEGATRLGNRARVMWAYFLHGFDVDIPDAHMHMAAPASELRSQGARGNGAGGAGA